jgi:hypothetical protein
MNNYLGVFQNLDIMLGELGFEVVVAELAEGDKNAIV